MTPTVTPSVADSGTGAALFTATQIDQNCPNDLIDLGKRIAAHLTRAAKADQKANDHRIAAGKLLAEAKNACDEGGFAAFHARFCPELGRSRAYELLAIATGKNTGEELRAANADRNRRLATASYRSLVRTRTRDNPLRGLEIPSHRS